MATDYNNEKWLDTLAANTYATDAWYTFGINWNKHIAASILNIPKAGNSINAQTLDDGTSLPVTGTKMTFGNKAVEMNIISYGPAYVGAVAEAEATFDTRSTMLQDASATLKQAVSIEVNYGWNADGVIGQTPRSTDTNTRLNIYGNTVKRWLFNDILNMRASLFIDSANTDTSNLYLVIDAVAHGDLTLMDDFTKADELAKQVAVDGYIGQILGFKVIQRTIGSPHNGTTLAKVITRTGANSYTDVHDNTHLSGITMLDATKVGYAFATPENGDIQIGIEEYAMGYFSNRIQAHTRCLSAPIYPIDAKGKAKGMITGIEAV